MTNEQTPMNLNDYLSSEANMLGKLVMWKVKESKVTRQTLVNAFYNNNIPNDFMPREISNAQAFRRALRIVEKQSCSGERYKGLVITKILEDQARIIFEIHEREINDVTETVSIQQAEKIVFNKSANSYEYGSHYADAIQDLLAECQNFYTSSNIRTIVTRLINDHITAIPLRERGGAYFVPANKMSFLNNIDQFIKDTTDGGLTMFPIYTPERKTLGNLAIEQLIGEFQEIQEEAEKALEDHSGPTKFNGRIEKWKSYRNKVSVYSDLLQFNAEKLTEAIEQSVAVIETKMNAYYVNNVSF